MKIEVIEYDGSFSIDMKPETVAEAAILVRLSLNATKELRSSSTDACRSGEIITSVVLGKKVNSNSIIRPT
jgi:hypothetical protein